jgi:enoyl-CoA hydratase
MELILSGNLIDATQAHQIGLVNHVTEPEQLMAETEKLLLTILSKSPHAVAQSIASINAGYHHSLHGYDEEIRLFAGCAGSEEMKEGVTAFLEKRKTNFRSSKDM